MDAIVFGEINFEIKMSLQANIQCQLYWRTSLLYIKEVHTCLHPVK